MVLKKMTARIADANISSRGTIKHARVAMRLCHDNYAPKLTPRNGTPLPQKVYDVKEEKYR